MYPFKRKKISIFGEEEDPYGTMTQFDTPQDDGVNPSDEEQDQTVDEPQSNKFTDIYNSAMDMPEGPANTRYRKFLEEEMPKREPPSKMNRLAAILGGASEGYFRGANAGMETTQKALDAPYEDKLRDYTIKSKALQGAAAIEDKTLGRRASFARTAATMARDEANAKIASDRILAQQTHWNAQDKAAADRLSSAGWVAKESKADGHLYFTKVMSDGTVAKKDAGKMGESIPETTKRESEEYRNRSNIIEGRERRVQTQRDEAATGRIQTTQDAIGRRQDKTIKAGEDRIKNNPHNMATDQILKMREIYAKYGDDAKDYFIFDPNTKLPIGLKPTDPDDENYKKIFKYIFSKE